MLEKRTILPVRLANLPEEAYNAELSAAEAIVAVFDNIKCVEFTVLKPDATCKTVSFRTFEKVFGCIYEMLSNRGRNCLEIKLPEMHATRLVSMGLIASFQNNTFHFDCIRITQNPGMDAIYEPYCPWPFKCTDIDWLTPRKLLPYYQNAIIKVAVLSYPDQTTIKEIVQTKDGTKVHKENLNYDDVPSKYSDLMSIDLTRMRELAPHMNQNTQEIDNILHQFIFLARYIHE